MGISASMSTILDIDTGIASYVGFVTTGATAVGAGNDAAIAAAIDVAIVFLYFRLCWLWLKFYLIDTSNHWLLTTISIDKILIKYAVAKNIHAQKQEKRVIEATK
jgi:hypothetical protein